MIFVYITGTAFLFLIISALFGLGHHGHGGFGHGHDLSHGHDLGHGSHAGHVVHDTAHHSTHTGHGDHSHSHDHSAEQSEKPGNLSIFSFQTILLFVTGFGIGGYFSDMGLLGYIMIALCGTAAGLGIGSLGYLFLNFLYRNQGTSTVNPYDYVGQIADVTISIPVGGPGKVFCQLPGKMQSFPARTDGDVPIPVHSRVRIVGFYEGSVTVEPLGELEAHNPTPWRS